MKVNTLIKILQEYNPNAEISTTFSEDITISYINQDVNKNKFTKKDTPMVFIEPYTSIDDKE